MNDRHNILTSIYHNRLIALEEDQALVNSEPEEVEHHKEGEKEVDLQEDRDRFWLCQRKEVREL